MPEWMLTTDEVEALVAHATGRLGAEQVRRRLAERGWPERDAEQLLDIASAEREAER